MVIEIAYFKLNPSDISCNRNLNTEAFGKEWVVPAIARINHRSARLLSTIITILPGMINLTGVRPLILRAFTAMLSWSSMEF
jgi:hypothetical protein